VNLLEVRNVTKTFGSLVAVSGVSLHVAPGELRAVIGPNGAGKTTFFNLISGFFPPNAGEIMFDGKDITAVSASARVRRSSDVRPAKITSAPYFRVPLTFTRGAVSGITTTARMPSSFALSATA